ncbi:MAG TPA: Stp1/IreP family PP2C-type Ser/Thr phosphatase [Actinomycetota bacterium]|nr:Stp1/IreP family PP2C-type Ser/Thr phosphatase [Actinomycetota bacterium]
MNVAVGARTDVGQVRDGNEDSYLLDEPLFAVADGMGGHLAGDVASSLAVDVIREGAGEQRVSDGDALAALVRNANARIYEKAQADASLRGMGTTCTLLLVRDDHAELAHVGDSRAYLFRAGELSQLTEDHTLVERMVREGRLSKDEAQHHPQRSIITRALGVDATVDVDVLSVELSEGDRLLLCSDGLTSMIDTGAIARILSDEADPQAAADRLVEEANGAGGEDNITVVVVDMTTAAGGRAAPPPPPAGDHARTDERPRADRIPHAQSPDATGAHAAAAPAPPRRRPWLRRVVVGVVVLAVLAGIAYAGVRYLLDDSWFVGVDDDGTVAIYRGIPEEVAGLTFSSVERETSLALDDVPESMRDQLEEGIKADSLKDAQAIVARFERRSRDIGGDAGRDRRSRDRRDDNTSRREAPSDAGRAAA